MFVPWKQERSHITLERVIIRVDLPFGLLCTKVMHIAILRSYKSDAEEGANIDFAAHRRVSEHELDAGTTLSSSAT